MDVQGHSYTQGDNKGYYQAMMDPFLDNSEVRDFSDREQLINLIWYLQEVLREGPVKEWRLYHLSGWRYKRFKKILEQLLKDPDSGVIRTPYECIGYTW